MTKNILITVLAALLLLSFFFGISQKIEAEKLRGLAIAFEEKAIAAQDAAEKQSSTAEEQRALVLEARRMAEANAIEALKQTQIAQETLKNCKGRK